MDDRDRRTRRGALDPSARVPGVISTYEIYHVDEAKLRLRWTDSAYRAARRRGLVVWGSGKRAYIAGDEIRRFLEAENAPAAAYARSRSPSAATEAGPSYWLNEVSNLRSFP